MNTCNAVTRNDDRGSKGNEVGHELWSSLRLILALCALFSLPVLAQDQPKDPTGMKRYEASVLIGYRTPRFDEYLMPPSVRQQAPLRSLSRKVSLWRARSAFTLTLHPPAGHPLSYFETTS